MGFFGKAFQFFVTALILTASIILTIIAPPTVAFTWAIAGKALLIGVTVTTIFTALTEILKPKTPSTPDYGTSVTSSSQPAQYIVGRSRAPGLITNYFKIEDGYPVSGNFFNHLNFPLSRSKGDYLYCLYTIANHACIFPGVVYMYFSGRKFRLKPVRGGGGGQFGGMFGRHSFDMIRTVRDANDESYLTNDEFNDLQRNFRERMQVLVNVTGDNTNNKSLVRFNNKRTFVGGPFAGTPTTIVDGPIVEPLVNSNTNISWVLVAFKSDKVWWAENGFDPRNVSFDVQGTDGDPAYAIRDFYARELKVPVSLFNNASVAEASRICGLYNRRANGVYLHNSKEEIHDALTQALDGVVFFHEDEFHIKSSHPTPLVFEINASMVVGNIRHDLKIDLQDYSNTVVAEINDANQDYAAASTGEVRNEQAIADDNGVVISNQLGTYRLVTSQLQARTYMVQNLARMARYSELTVEIFLEEGVTDTFQVYNRGRVRMYEEEEIDDVYRIQNRIDTLEGVIVLNLVRDPDDVYIRDEAELPIPIGPSIPPSLSAKVPVNLQVIGKLQVSFQHYDIEVTIAWESPESNTEAFLTIYKNGGLFIKEYVSQDLFKITGVNIGDTFTVQVHGVLKSQLSTEFVTDSLEITEEIATPIIQPFILHDRGYNELTDSWAFRWKTQRFHVDSITFDYAEFLTETNENERGRGIWSDGETLYIVEDGKIDPTKSKIYAYNLLTRQPDPSQDFDTLVPAGNVNPFGIAGNDNYIWVVNDETPNIKVFAYNRSTKQREPSQDFDTLTAAGNVNPTGIYVTPTTTWIGDRIADKLFAYNTVTKQRDQSKDITPVSANGDVIGLAGETNVIWVTDWIDHYIYAYNPSTGDRVPTEEFDVSSQYTYNGVTAYMNPNGVWASNDVLYINNTILKKVYAFDLSTKQRIPQKDINSLDRTYEVLGDFKYLDTLPVPFARIFQYINLPGLPLADIPHTISKILLKATQITTIGGALIELSSVERTLILPETRKALNPLGTQISGIGGNFALKENLLSIATSPTTESYDAEEAEWAGTLDNCVVLKDSNVIIPKSEVNANQVTWAQWTSNDPTILFAKRTRQEFSYETPFIHPPTDTRGSREVREDFTITLNLGDLRISGFQEINNDTVTWKVIYRIYTNSTGFVLTGSGGFDNFATSKGEFILTSKGEEIGEDTIGIGVQETNERAITDKIIITNVSVGDIVSWKVKVTVKDNADHSYCIKDLFILRETSYT